MTLGQRIQTFRKKQCLSQEALGERLGVSRQAISKWESDLTIPELDKLIAMSRLFGVSLDDLMGMEEPEKPEKPEKARPAEEKLLRRWLAGLTVLCLLLTGAVGLLWGQNRLLARTLAMMDVEYASYGVELFDRVDYQLSDIEMGFPYGGGTQPLRVKLEMEPVEQMSGWRLTALHLVFRGSGEEERMAIDVSYRGGGVYSAEFVRDNYGGERITVTAVFTQKGTGLVARQEIFHLGSTYNKWTGVEALQVREYSRENGAYIPKNLALTFP